MLEVIKEKDGGDEAGEVDRGVLHLEAQLVRVRFDLLLVSVWSRTEWLTSWWTPSTIRVYLHRRIAKGLTRRRSICITSCWTALSRCVSISYLAFARGSLDVVFVYWRGDVRHTPYVLGEHSLSMDVCSPSTPKGSIGAVGEPWCHDAVVWAQSIGEAPRYRNGEPAYIHTSQTLCIVTLPLALRWTWEYSSRFHGAGSLIMTSPPSYDASNT